MPHVTIPTSASRHVGKFFSCCLEVLPTQFQELSILENSKHKERLKILLHRYRSSVSLKSISLFDFLSNICVFWKLRTESLLSLHSFPFAIRVLCVLNIAITINSEAYREMNRLFRRFLSIRNFGFDKLRYVVFAEVVMSKRKHGRSGRRTRATFPSDSHRRKVRRGHSKRHVSCFVLCCFPTTGNACYFFLMLW